MSHRWPDPGALELLVAVAEQGGVGAAARSLDMAQPNASRTLRRLEQDLRVVLLERGPQGSVLTPEGELVVAWARGVLGQSQTLLDGVALLRRERAARVAVAATPSIAEHLMPMWVAELRSAARARAPQWYRGGAGGGRASLDPAEVEVEVDLTVVSSHEVLRRVARSEAALGFTEEPARGAGLEVVTFGSEGLVVLVAPHHPWARREPPVTPAEMARTPLVLPSAGSSVRRALDHALAPYDPVPPRTEVATPGRLVDAVAGGASPGVLNSLDAAQAIRSGRVAVVATRVVLARPLQVIWPKGGRPGGPAGELVGIAEAHARRHVAAAPVG